MASYIETEREKNILKFDTNRKFGDTNTGGLQHKGMGIVDGKETFIKLDDLNPTVSGTWENGFDYQYSSISEAIVSCLVKNIEKDDNFQSVTYNFEVFENAGKLVTGTTSNNYLNDNEVERVLASGNKAVTHTSVPLDDYVEQIIDVPMDRRLDNLVKLYIEQNVPQEIAKHFTIQQAGFDILTGNIDRLNNPSNFIVAYNAATNEGRPINIDYGRCAQMIWTSTSETNFRNEYYDEIVEDASLDMISRSDSIFSSYQITDSISRLKKNGYQPFRINIEGLTDDLTRLNNKIESENIGCKNFASIKLEAFKQALQLPKMQELWQDTRLALDFAGIEERSVEK